MQVSCYSPGIQWTSNKIFTYQDMQLIGMSLRICTDLLLPSRYPVDLNQNYYLRICIRSLATLKVSSRLQAKQFSRDTLQWTSNKIFTYQDMLLVGMSLRILQGLLLSSRYPVDINQNYYLRICKSLAVLLVCSG